MLSVLAAAAFSTFVIAGLRLWRSGLPADVRRRRVNVFLTVVLAISFGTGLAQRELWPFSSWPLVAGTLGDEVTLGRILAVDADGAEHDVDYRAWQPLSVDELMAWMDAVFPQLDRGTQERAAAHLVALAERARARANAGGTLGTSQRFLGPLAAPFFILHPRRWSDPASVPRRALTGLRYYRETWSLDAHARGSTDVRRDLVFELSSR
jgi:hypothetical protein